MKTRTAEPAHAGKAKDDEIARYSHRFATAHARICTRLRNEIARAMPKAASRIWHAIPVWFIDGNPVVGYHQAGDRIQVLFWNGQAFIETGLEPVGKFHAARVRYASLADVDITDLRRWLKKARTDIWDYQGLRTGKVCRSPD